MPAFSMVLSSKVSVSPTAGLAKVFTTVPLRFTMQESRAESACPSMPFVGRVMLSVAFSAPSAPAVTLAVGAAGAVPGVIVTLTFVRRSVLMSASLQAFTAK